VGSLIVVTLSGWAHVVEPTTRRSRAPANQSLDPAPTNQSLDPAPTAPNQAAGADPGLPETVRPTAAARSADQANAGHPRLENALDESRAVLAVLALQAVRLVAHVAPRRSVPLLIVRPRVDASSVADRRLADRLTKSVAVHPAAVGSRCVFFPFPTFDR